MSTKMSRPSLLRIRRFGNAAARDAALSGNLEAATASLQAVQGILDEGIGPFSAPLVPELRLLGWDAHDLILGVAEVRSAWEREHGPLPQVRGVSDPDVLLALAEIRRLRPDFILDNNVNVLDSRLMSVVRRSIPSRSVTVGYLGTEKRFHRARGLDLVLVPCETMKTAFAPYANGRVEVLPHSFDPKSLASLPERTVTHPLTFAGSLGPRYSERHRVLMALLETTDIEAWIGLRKGVKRDAAGWLTTPEQVRMRNRLSSHMANHIPVRLLATLTSMSERVGPTFNRRIMRKTGGLAAPTGRLRDPHALYPNRCHPAVSGIDYLALLRSSGAVVHRGIDALGGCAGALRLFEVTGAGAALLVEDSEMVHALFEVGKEVVTYSDADDAVKKAQWLAAHPAAREEIALAGHRRTLRDHTIAARALSLDVLLRRMAARRGVRS